MSLQDVLRTLASYWRSLLVIFLVTAAAGSVFLMLQPPQYTSRAVVYLIPRAGGAAGQLAAAQEYAITQSKTFAALVSSPAVMQPVHEKLGLGGSPSSLVGRVRATAPGETASIVLSATDGDAQFAHDLVAATADQLLVAFDEYTAPGSSQVLEAQIMEPATMPTRPSSPDFLRNLLTALAIGLALGVAQALLRSYLDNAVDSPEAVGRVTTHRVIGEIPVGRLAGTAQGQKPGEFSRRGEAYRRLRTNLQFLTLDAEKKSVLVTSSIPGEGKTETAAALAFAMSEAGVKTLLVDADLRRPQVAKHHDVENSVGLTSILLHQAPLESVVQRAEGYDVLASGPIPPNPSELLGTASMKKLLDEASADYDMVIIDTPPLLAVTDAAVLSQSVGGVLVIADTQRLKRGQLKHALANIEGVNGTILGIALNKVRTAVGGYGYGYGYGYSYEYGSGGKSKRLNKGAKRSAGRVATDRSKTIREPERSAD